MLVFSLVNYHILAYKCFFRLNFELRGTGSPYLVGDSQGLKVYAVCLPEPLKNFKLMARNFNETMNF